MHARAHPDNDPIYAGMRALRMAKQGDAVGRKCQTCHNPQAPDTPDSKAGRAGVACGACHGLEATGQVADGRDTCLQCHDATKNPAGVATCTTGPENTAMGGAPCSACHMPRASDGHAQHTFAGPHRAWLQDDPSFLASALSASLQAVDGGAEVSVTNTTGHGFPTGFPGRVASVLLTGRGPDGPWSSAPAFVFRKVYVDAEGAPTLPPFAASLAEDSRLTPGETRTATVPVPDGVEDLDVTLQFHLLPPPAAAVLGVTGDLAAPKRVSLLRR
jgi:hypothetical protein